MRFRECERIQTILGSVDFSTFVTLHCNPGLASAFPWLSGHAALFEHYKIHRLVYRYKNLKGTSSSGNIIMSFDYDTLDAAPSTAIAATQSTHYVDGAPWRIFELKIPPDGRKLFTRSTTPVGVDLKTYDMGAVHISTEGCADTTVHGYLEVEYDIEFFNKQPSGTGIGSLSNVAQFAIVNPTTLSASGPLLFDTTVINDLSIVTKSNGEFTVPKGRYTFLVRASATNVFITLGLRMLVNGSPLVPAVSAPVKDASDPGTCFGTLDLAVSSNVSVYIDVGAGSPSPDASTQCSILFTKI